MPASTAESLLVISARQINPDILSPPLWVCRLSVADRWSVAHSCLLAVYCICIGFFHHVQPWGPFFSFQHFKWHVTAGYSKSSTGLWSPSCNIVARFACVKDLSLPLSLCRSGTLIGVNVLDNWFEDILLHALRARQVMRCLPLLM